MLLIGSMWFSVFTDEKEKLFVFVIPKMEQRYYKFVLKIFGSNVLVDSIYP